MPYDERRRKGEQVEEMFDSIAPAYDLMNTAMTFGLHNYWRGRALRALERELESRGEARFQLLDVATGTGDVVFDLLRRFPSATITGVDLSGGMLEIARKKLQEQSLRDRGRVSFEQADCLSLPYGDESFDAITVAYGVRNFQQLTAGYREMWRVLKPGGVLCVIELSSPEHQPFKFGYNLYSRRLIPLVGRMVSGDSRAYSYLPESIAACPQRGSMTRKMEESGFRSASYRSLTFGVVTLYFARK